jgi:hypothetical protein
MEVVVSTEEVGATAVGDAVVGAGAALAWGSPPVR